MKLFWNKTNHKAGGLIGLGKELGNRLSLPSGWVPPPYIDLRGYCLPKSDQGNSSQCVAYSMAGLLEVRNWQHTHIPTQIDPAPMYAEAKRIDNDGMDGTTLTTIFEAAKNLGRLPKNATAVYFKSFEDYMFALHQYGVVLLGFRINDGWSYASRSSGWIPDGTHIRGGHAVLGVWGDLRRGCGFQNSWGEWGADGFGRLTIEQYAGQIMGGLAVDFPD